MALIVLDASVLIGFLDPTDELHGRARAALQARDVVEEVWVVPTTVCAELLVGAYRAGDDEGNLAERFLSEGVERIEPATFEIARTAARIRAEHARLSLADAFVLATGEVVDAAMTLTADRAWTRVSRRVRIA
jgi:predicted nucleic acid-binding protein